MSGPETNLLIHYHMHHTCLIPIWIVVYRRQWLYLMLCISRILPGRDIFSLDIKIYLYLNICDHSVAESKSRDLVIVFILLQGHSGTSSRRQRAE